MLMIRFDLRVPEISPTTHAAQYAACLEMCEWAERNGFMAATLSEHHGTDDGYLPAPLPFVAILARTNQIAVTVAAVILPLHDPVRIAEECAVIDNVAPGRLALVVANGYRARPSSRWPASSGATAARCSRSTSVSCVTPGRASRSSGAGARSSCDRSPRRRVARC